MTIYHNTPNGIMVSAADFYECAEAEASALRDFANIKNECDRLRAQHVADQKRIAALVAGLKYISEHDYRGTGLNLGRVIEDMRAQARASLTLAGIQKGE